MAEEAAAPASPPEKATRRQWIAVLGAILGAFMAVLDIQITNASLQNILGSLSATLDEGSWISTAYLVAEIIVIPLSGWLAQVFTLRRYLIWSAASFLLCSVLCALSWNLSSMITFRALQGLSGGALIPLATNLVLTIMPPKQRPLALACFGFCITFAPSVGPALGGYLTDTFSWVAIFYINLLPGALLIAAIVYGLDKKSSRLELLKSADWGGIGTMAIGLGALTVFLEEGNRKEWLDSPLIVWLGLVAVLALAVFLYLELTVKKPFINLRLFKRRNFGLGCLVNFGIGLGLFGSIYILPIYLAQIQSYNALQIGEVIMWMGLPQLFILPFLPLLLKRFDLRGVIFLGACLFAISAFMNSVMSHETGLDQLRWSQIVRALGQPLIMIPLSTLTTGQIEREQAGSASGLFNMMRNLGGSVGIALLGTLLSMRERFHSQRLGEAITAYDPIVQDRLDQLQQRFTSFGSDSVSATNQALAALNSVVQREAFVLAYNDCFLLIGGVLVMGSIIVLFCHRVKPGAEHAGGH